jgi:hypothetical protein
MICNGDMRPNEVVWSEDYASISLERRVIVDASISAITPPEDK